MSHRIQLQPSGLEFTVEAGKTILEAAHDQGIRLPFGCQNGFCGACKLKVISGEYSYQDDYQPQVLTDEEQADGLCICCKAEPTGDMVIEAETVEMPSNVETRTLEVTISNMKQLSENVMQLFLKPEGEPLQFMAGQYIDIVLPDGKRRAFSIANTPREDGLIELHLRLIDDGFFTPKVFEEMKAGDKLTIEGPLGTFVLRENSDRPMVMVAGGTGIAPIKAMIEQMIQSGGINRPMSIYWGVRGQQNLYFNDQLEKWAAEHENITYIPVLSDAEEDESWEGRKGYVQGVVIVDYDDMSDVDVYMAGPPMMINAGKSVFARLGLPDSQLFYDSFETAGKAEN